MASKKGGGSYVAVGNVVVLKEGAGEQARGQTAQPGVGVAGVAAPLPTETKPAGSVLSEAELGGADAVKRLLRSGAVRLATAEDQEAAEQREQQQAAREAAAEAEAEQQALARTHESARRELERKHDREKAEALAKLADEQAGEMAKLAEQAAASAPSGGEAPDPAGDATRERAGRAGGGGGGGARSRGR